MNAKQTKPSFFGYLKVKRPADQRYSLIRSWRKRLVTVRIGETQDDNGQINVVEILLGKKQAFLASKNSQNDQTNQNDSLKKVPKPNRNRFELKSNNCVIYRCRSRKEAHAFVLANQIRPLLYLAANNEVLCQHWIKTIRDALWPPNSQEAALESGKQVFPVSLLDNEYSFRANLVGIYGYICYDLPHKLVLRNSQDGTLITDWTLNTISMRLVGEATDQSFALIERVSLNNEHIFVEMNSDFIPSHLEKDKTISTTQEQMYSDCNLILMNCSMDATTGPGLITFFSENAYQLVKYFKEIKRLDLAKLRRKQQIANANNILIEDLIVDSHDQPDSDFYEINERMNGRLSVILHRKLSNALMGFSDEEYGDMEDALDNSLNDSTTNLMELVKIVNSKLDDTFAERAIQLKFDHRLPLYASSSELLDDSSQVDGLERIAQSDSKKESHSLNSASAKKCRSDAKFVELNRSKNQEFEYSSSSSE